MSKGINHGTQPQKGTITLSTVRRSDQKLLHKNAGKQRKQTCAKKPIGDNSKERHEQRY